MSILNVIGMIPRGGKFAKSVVNFVHKTPQNWEKFKSAIQQIDDVLKKGKLRLDGKQKTNFEANKNILKIHEKVTKKVEVPPSVKKEFPAFNISKEDYTKGWKPTVYERQNLRNIYKDKLNPPERLYTKEMEAIDEELNELMLYGNSKYAHLNQEQKVALHEKLQAEMQKLIKIAKKNDLSNLSLSQLNKKSHDLQKRIREIADNPNIPGTVTEGPKRDMIKILYDAEQPSLTKARTELTRKNSELIYGKEFPILDPKDEGWIILGIDEAGNPMKISRFSGKFSASPDKTTGKWSKSGTGWYDTWDPKKKKIRESGKEVWQNTTDKEGKVIMSNPDYKIADPKNLDVWNELYSDVSINELAKRGHNLKDIDMLVKGREVKNYLKAQEAAEPKLDIYEKLHERSSTSGIANIMQDLYLRGDDVYKMSVKEWIEKIPEYFAEGGRTGFHRGSLRHQKTHDYKAYAKKSDYWKQSPPENWLATLLGQEKMGYNEQRDAFESYMKERFMYGEKKQPLTNLSKSRLDKKINAWIKELFTKEKRNKHATGGVSNLFRKKFKKGTYRDRLQKDYESLTKGADWMRTAPPAWWLFPEYDPLGSRDDTMTWFKERFMYGDLDAIPTPLEAIKQSPELVKFMKWLEERKGHATGGVSNLFRSR